jgi:hypothetical protein
MKIVANDKERVVALIHTVALSPVISQHTEVCNRFNGFSSEQFYCPCHKKPLKTVSLILSERGSTGLKETV